MPVSRFRPVAASAALAPLTLFLARGLPAGLRAILFFSLVNHMTKDEFASIATAFVLVETLRFACDCGQDTISVKLLSRPGKLWVRTIYPCLLIKACSWSLSLTVNFILVWTFIQRSHLATALAIALIGASPLFWNLPINLLQARKLLGDHMKAVLCIAAILCVAVCMDSRFASPRLSIAIYAAIEYAGILAMAFLAFVSARTLRLELSRIRVRLRHSQISLYLSRGWTVCVGQLAALAYSKLDVYLVSRFAPAAAVAVYLFAQRIFDLTNFLTGGAATVMYANMATKLRLENPNAWLLARYRWATVFALHACALAVIFWVVSPFAIRAWFQSMSASIPYLAILGIIALLSVASQYMTALLNSIGRFRPVSRLNLMNLVLIFCGGIPVFHLYGITGFLSVVAVVYVIGVAVQWTVLSESQRELGLRFS